MSPIILTLHILGLVLALGLLAHFTGFARFFIKRKDGGPDSNVTGYWLVECKALFSIVLLRFSDGSRDNFHGHAFSSISWFFRGISLEEQFTPALSRFHQPSWRPIVTLRTMLHRVVAYGTCWVLSFRGPWARTWLEWDPVNNSYIELGKHREVLGVTTKLAPV